MITDRIIQLEGAFNVRDLGGVQNGAGQEVNTGRLFRSDALHLLTESDLDTLANHAIATVIDLREEYEIARTGKARLTESGAHHIHMPLMGADANAEPLKPEEFPPTMGEGYVLMLEACVAPLASVIERIVEDDAMPVIFHCAGGKDRTGILAAIIYMLLDVDAETIATDYALTEAALERLHARNPISMYPEAKNYPAHFFGISADTMLHFVATINEKHGGADAFLLQAGLKQDSLDRLRVAMLD